MANRSREEQDRLDALANEAFRRLANNPNADGARHTITAGKDPVNQSADEALSEMMGFRKSVSQLTDEELKELISDE